MYVGSDGLEWAESDVRDEFGRLHIHGSPHI